MKSHLAAFRESLESKMSKAELARRVGVHRSHITRLEQGKVRPSAKVMLKLARALQCDATALFELDRDPRGEC
jgi:transcriptional regulator with XRE-family HTH domain